MRDDRIPMTQSPTSSLPAWCDPARQDRESNDLQFGTLSWVSFNTRCCHPLLTLARQKLPTWSPINYKPCKGEPHQGGSENVDHWVTWDNGIAQTNLLDARRQNLNDPIGQQGHFQLNATPLHKTENWKDLQFGTLSWVSFNTGCCHPLLTLAHQ